MIREGFTVQDTPQDIDINICKKCNRVKVIHDFFKDNSTNLGYRKICKQCHNEHLRPSPVRSRRYQDKYEVEVISISPEGYYDVLIYVRDKPHSKI